MLVILLDALITRTGWELPDFVKLERQPKVKKGKVAKAVKVVVAKVSVPVEEKKAVEADTEAPSERRSRFQKAKDRR